MFQVISGPCCINVYNPHPRLQWLWSWCWKHWNPTLGLICISVSDVNWQGLWLLSSNPRHFQLPGIGTRWLNQSAGSRDPPFEVRMNEGGCVKTFQDLWYQYWYHIVGWRSMCTSYVVKPLKTARIEPFPGCQMKKYDAAAAVQYFAFPEPGPCDK